MCVCVCVCVSVYTYMHIYIISQTLYVKFQTEGRDMKLHQSKSVALYTAYSLTYKEILTADYRKHFEKTKKKTTNAKLRKYN